MKSTALLRWTPIAISAAVLMAACAAPVAAQSALDARNLVVPQWRHVIIPHPHPMPVPQPVERPVELAAVDAAISIDGRHAVTTLTITLKNPGGRPQESAVLLPVPAGAVFKGFQLDGVAGNITAELMPRDEARRIYDEIVRRMIDPGLLEFAGTGVIRSSVFPVPPGGTMKARVVYEEWLAEANGRVEYVLPRGESLDAGAPWSVALDWKMPGGPATLYCPSHPAEIKTEADGRAILRLGGSMQAGSLRVTAVPPAGAGTASMSIAAYPPAGGEDGYFLLVAAPPAAVPEKPMPREVTLVFDRSGSMAGGKLDQVKAAAIQLVEGLGEEESFNIISYNEAVTTLFPGPRQRDQQATLDARAFIQGTRPSGGTNIHAALLAAVTQPVTPGTLPVVIFLTDGLPTVGQTLEKSIRDEIAKANTGGRRIFTFGAGLDVNTPLLARLAEDSRATADFVLPREDVEWKVVSLFRRLSGPAVARPVLSVLGADGRPAVGRIDDIVPSALPDIFHGDSLVVTGRFRAGGPLTMVLEGDGVQGKSMARLTFDPGTASTAEAHVPRLWATRRIAVLTDALRDMGSGGGPGGNGLPPADESRAKELVDEIVRLSLKHGVLSEYTAFLARDGMAFAPAAGTALPMARENFARRAMESRSGAGAVNQEVNLSKGKSAAVVDKANRFVDAELKETNADEVRQVADKAFFRNNGVWTDSRAPKDAGGAITELAIGSPEFDRMVDRLVANNRQSVLGLPGDLVFEDDGKLYRIRKNKH